MRDEGTLGMLRRERPAFRGFSLFTPSLIPHPPSLIRALYQKEHPHERNLP